MPDEIDEPARTFLPIDRRWLFGMTGVIWSAVGVLLLSYPGRWLAPVGLSLELARSRSRAGRATSSPRS